MRGFVPAALLAIALVAAMPAPTTAEEGPESRASALAAASLKAWDQTLRVLLARAAVEAAPIPDAVNALYAALDEHSETAVLRHPSAVNSAAFTADGARVVTACEDGVLRVWSAAGAVEGTSAPGRPTVRVWPLGAADRVLAATRGATADVIDLALWTWDSGAAAPTSLAPLVAGAALRNVAVSPTGDAVAAIGPDGAATLWDRDGKAVRTLAARTLSMSPKGGAVVFVTPDGKAVLAGVKGSFRVLEYGRPVTHAEFAPSGDVLVWGNDVRVVGFAGDGRKRFEVRHDAPVEGACGNAAGDLVTIGGGRRFACYETGGSVRHAWPREGAFTCAAMSPQREFVATVAGGTNLTFCFDGLAPATDTLPSEARSVEVNEQGFHFLVRLASGKPLVFNPNMQEVRLLGGEVTAAVFHPSGRWVLAGAKKGAAVLQPFYGPPGTFLLGHVRAVTDVAFSPAGDRAVTSSADGTARVWAIQPRGTESIQPTKGPDCWGALWSWTQDRIATFSWNEIRFTDGRGRLLAEAHHPEVIQRQASGDERVAVTLRGGTAAYLYTRDGKLVGEMSLGAETAGVTTSQRGDRFAVWGTTATEIRFFDARAKQIGTIDAESPVGSAAISLDGKRLFVGMANGAARIYPATGGARPSAEWKLPAPAAWGDVLPKSDLVVTLATDAPSVGLWTTKGARVADLAARGPVMSYGWTSTGDSIVVGSKDRTARVFDARGRPGVVLDHPDTVNACRFLPDDRRILTTCADGAARLWTREGTLLAKIPAHTKTCWSAGFDKTGDWIVTAGGDYRARIWPATTERLLETAAARAFRGFTDDERREYGPLLR